MKRYIKSKLRIGQINNLLSNGYEVQCMTELSKDKTRIILKYYLNDGEYYYELSKYQAVKYLDNLAKDNISIFKDIQDFKMGKIPFNKAVEFNMFLNTIKNSNELSHNEIRYKTMLEVYNKKETNVVL